MAAVVDTLVPDAVAHGCSHCAVTMRNSDDCFLIQLCRAVKSCPIFPRRGWECETEGRMGEGAGGEGGYNLPRFRSVGGCV